MLARSRSPWWVFPLVVLASACLDDVDPAAIDNSDIAPVVSAHLNQMVDVMQNNSINRLSINWTSFRSIVLARAAGAQNIPAAYSAIREALAMLGDNHSSYRAPDGTVLFAGGTNCTAVTVSSPVVPNNIGYVRVTSFSGGGDLATAFANEIQNVIVTADRADLVGWVVDLRGNGGGNMWPMLAGVGPVLGEGVAGHFITPTGARSAWEYRDGAAWNSGQAVQRTTVTYRLRRERPRVAVLTDGRVASSGEAIAVAFRQRPDTRSFGTPTCGLSTANAGFGLSEGASLNLTVALMADRTGAPYGSALAPDETITVPETLVQRALAWVIGG